MNPTPCYCRSCSYDLRAQFSPQVHHLQSTSPSTGIISLGSESSPRCPECGRPFEPANPKSFARCPRRTGLRRWSVRLALSLLFLALALAGSWCYLYRGYQREQAAIKSLYPISYEITSQPLGGHRLQYALGRAGFVLDRAREIQIDYHRPHPSNLVPLRDLHCLDAIEIQCYVSDSELHAISACKNLTTLEIIGSAHPLTDAGLANLHSLPKLRHLTLNRCDKITDAGLEQLHQITTLREIKINAALVSPAALKSLQSALPRAKISAP